MSKANLYHVLNVNGSDYDLNDPESLKALTTSPVQHLKDLGEFLLAWSSDTEHIIQQTSGSTGSPKQLLVGKSQMINSARLTIKFFGLQQGMTALLCMSPEFIGGRMMVVRALVAGMKLLVVKPTDNPLKAIGQTVDFAAMVPFQFAKALKESSDKFRFINTLILGGAHLSAHLEEAAQQLPTRVWHTYGMSETLSHIALRPVNGPKRAESFTPLPGIELSLDERNCLLVKAPILHIECLKTNDIAVLRSDGTFIISGRDDNVINSAGVKIHPEQLEHQLASIMPSKFAVAGKPDMDAGQLVVLVMEGHPTLRQIFDIWKSIERLTNSSVRPRRIITVDSLPLTATGKIDRRALQQMLAGF